MLLRCPVCRCELQKSGRTAVCANRHSFDYARQGYLNLFLSHGGSHGDSAESVRARTRFLSRGHYGFLKDRLQELSASFAHQVTVDLACGEGYYTAALYGNEKYGFDLSRDALKHAAKNDPSAQYTVASIFDLPFASGAADLVTTCFAPIAKDEIMRILKPGGIFISVTPAADHLFELKQILYETPYLNTEDEPPFPLKEEQQIREVMHLDHDAVMDLFAMTPYYYHTSEADRRKLDETDHLDITASFLIRIFQK